MVCFNVILFTFSLLMTTVALEAIVDSVDQDQTAQNVQSDLLSTLSTFSFQIITKIVSSSCDGNVFLADEKHLFIYSVLNS